MFFFLLKLGRKQRSSGCNTDKSPAPSDGSHESAAGVFQVFGRRTLISFVQRNQSSALVFSPRVPDER